MKRNVLSLVLLSLVWGLCLANGGSLSSLRRRNTCFCTGGESNSLDPGEAFTFEAIKVADWAFDGLVRQQGRIR